MKFLKMHSLIFLMTSVNIRDEIFKDAFINISYDQCKYKR